MRNNIAKDKIKPHLSIDKTSSKNKFKPIISNDKSQKNLVVNKKPVLSNNNLQSVNLNITPALDHDISMKAISIKDKDIEIQAHLAKPEFLLTTAKDTEEELNERKQKNISPNKKHFHNQVHSSDISNTSQIRVISRFRPLNSAELEMSSKNIGSICVKFPSEETVTVQNNLNTPSSFTLDRIFDMNTSQQSLYEMVAKPTIGDVLNGYNGTIFTYGQSGSGKTYSMYGTDLYDDTSKGIIPRAIEEIFEYINNDANKEIKFELKFSMLEIYKENLHDLLSPETKSSELKIKEHPKKGIYVTNLSEEYISSEEEFLMMIENADDYRVVSETGLNKTSSRSHLLFQLEIIQKFPDDTESRGMLNLVDLAGSEKVAKTHAVGETLEEAKKINLSLSTLGNVISALTSSKGDFVPYRDSKLTRILQDSLGGNYKTTLVVTCSPHIYNCEETISTLKFASRAKKIKNKVKMNIKRSVEQLEAIIESLTKQLSLANEEIVRLKGIPISGNGEILMNSLPYFITTNNDISQQTVFTFPSNANSRKESKTNIVFIDNNRQIQENINFNNNHYLNIIKQKDEEIQILNDKIDTLQEENKSLQDKLSRMSRETGYIYFYQILENLENVTKRNIEDIKSLHFAQSNSNIEQLKNENDKLRENYKMLETKYFQTIKEIENKFKLLENNNNANFNDNSIFAKMREEFDIYRIKFTQFIENNNNVNSNNLTNSYQTIFNNSKMFLNTLIKDFFKKKHMFGTKYSNTKLDINIIEMKNENKKTKSLKTEYIELKDSYIKMQLLIIFYENITFDLMNRILVDLKKFEMETNNKLEMGKKCDNLNSSLMMYLEILEDMKEMKLRKDKEEKRTTLSARVSSEIKESVFEENKTLNSYSKEKEGIKIPQSILKKVFNSKEKESEDDDQHKIDETHNKNANFKSVSVNPASRTESFDFEDDKKRTRLETNYNYLKKMHLINQDTPKALNNESKNSGYNPTTPPNQNIISIDTSKFHNNINITRPVNKKKSSRFLNNLNMIFNKLVKVDGINFSSTFAGGNTISVVEARPLNTNETKVDDNEKVGNLNFVREKTNVHRPNAINWLKESIVSNTNKLYNFNNIKENNNEIFTELKQLKKELLIYKNTVRSLSGELNYLKENSNQIDNMIAEFQQNQKQILDIELENISHTLSIYKNFYEEEIKHKRTTIEELAKVIDDICINTIVPKDNDKGGRPQSMILNNTNNIFANFNLLPKSNTRKKNFIYDYLEYKKEKIIGDLRHSRNEYLNDNSVIKIAEAILEDGGTATKKMDYILFQIEKNFEELKVEYGSGLHGCIPSKSPLCRNLKLSFVGDTHSDVDSPDIID